MVPEMCNSRALDPLEKARKLDRQLVCLVEPDGMDEAAVLWTSVLGDSVGNLVSVCATSLYVRLTS